MFKQTDLEAGKHMVVTRDKGVYIIANSHTPADEWLKGGDKLFLMSPDGYCGLGDYKDFKLKGANGTEPSLDIVEVYSITSAGGGFKHPQWQTLVWQEDAVSKVKQKIVQLENDIDNRDYHNSRARDNIKELEMLL